MRPLRIYVETSVVNFFFAHKEREMQGSTALLLDNIKSGMHLGFSSDLVAAELGATPDPAHRKRLLQILEDYPLTLLNATLEADRLAQRLVLEGCIPRGYFKDALHIGIALVHEMDVLASWNLDHIVKLKTRRVVAGLAKLEGYRELEIATPGEVVEHG